MKKKRGRKAKKIKISRIIKTLILSDVVSIAGWGLLWPIFAIFLREEIGLTLLSVGIASTIFVVTRCAVQLPVAKYVDKHSHKANLLILSAIVSTITPLLFILAQNIYHIYGIQVFHAIGAALGYPTFLSLFSTHLSKKHESFQWGLYTTYTGMVTAITAFVGAWIATNYGFNALFFMVSGFSFIRMLVLCTLEKREIKGIKDKGRERLISIVMGRRKDIAKPEVPNVIHKI